MPDSKKNRRTNDNKEKRPWRTPRQQPTSMPPGEMRQRHALLVNLVKIVKTIMDEKPSPKQYDPAIGHPVL